MPPVFAVKLWHLIVACLVTALAVSAAYRDDHRIASAVVELARRNGSVSFHVSRDSSGYTVSDSDECVINPGHHRKLRKAVAGYLDNLLGYR